MAPNLLLIVATILNTEESPYTYHSFIYLSRCWSGREAGLSYWNLHEIVTIVPEYIPTFLKLVFLKSTWIVTIEYSHTPH